MRRNAVQEHTALLLVLALTAGPPVAMAQTSGSAAPKATTTTTTTTATASASDMAAETFSAEQLEQLVAPIALYADSLLTQIFMASTYPLEIVQADRFMQANPGLKDAQLDEKLKEQDWDPSVKSLCKVPDTLKKMSENLDWTQDLGDAFLAQQKELLDTVQRMRGKANDSGNLKTTTQQTVTVTEEKIIVIESPSPEVVYVPTYSPTVVYGGWGYPSYPYPAMYPYYPPGAGLISFGIGMAVGGALWGNCNWGRGDVDINVNRYNNFNRNTNINANRTNLSGNRSSWQHNASHRQGVNYRNSATASKYGAKQGTNRVSRDQARGYSGANSGSRQARTPSATAQDRSAGSGSRGSGSGGGSRSPSASTRDRSAGSGSGSRDYGSGSSSRGGAYSGSSSPKSDRASSSRGASSRGTSSYGGSRSSGSYGGGGSRSSGGGGGGGSRGGGGGGGSRGGGGGGGGSRGGGGGGGGGRRR